MPLLLLLLFGGGVAAVVAKRRWDIDVGEDEAVLTVRRPRRAPAVVRQPVPPVSRALLPPPPSRPQPRPVKPAGVVSVGRFTGRFGVRRSATHVHKGIDISAKRGTPVNAINKGVVEGVYPDGQRYGYGNSVLLKHPDGKRSFYAHLDSIKVRLGQQVDLGEQIGTVGSTQKRIRGGKVRPNPRPHMPPHLHMEVQTNVVLDKRGRPIIGEDIPNRIDPLVYMSAVGSRPVGTKQVS